MSYELLNLFFVSRFPALQMFVCMCIVCGRLVGLLQQPGGGGAGGDAALRGGGAAAARGRQQQPARRHRLELPHRRPPLALRTAHQGEEMEQGGETIPLLCWRAGDGGGTAWRGVPAVRGPARLGLHGPGPGGRHGGLPGAVRGALPGHARLPGTQHCRHSWVVTLAD